MSLSIILILGAVFGSTSIIAAANKNGFLQGALTRTIAGGTGGIVGSSYLVGYTNLEYFISASFNGSLGISGYIFIGGLSALLITWAANLVSYRVAIK